jgi:hypothetical protein
MILNRTSLPAPSRAPCGPKLPETRPGKWGAKCDLIDTATR